MNKSSSSSDLLQYKKEFKIKNLQANVRNRRGGNETFLHSSKESLQPSTSRTQNDNYDIQERQFDLQQNPEREYENSRDSSLDPKIIRERVEDVDNNSFPLNSSFLF